MEDKTSMEVWKNGSMEVPSTRHSAGQAAKRQPLYLCD